MRIAVCDDDLRERERFEEALKGWDPSCGAEKFASGASLLAAAKEFPQFDIVFLDIYMPGENGIKIAEALREISPETGIVFVTVSRDFAVDAFSLYAVHYLIKPITTDGITEAFRRLTESRAEHREQITLAAGSERHTLFLDQICYFESDNHTVDVSLADGRKLKIRTSFGKLEEKMDKKFLRINRGISVNMDYISQLRTDTCILRDGVRLPVAVRQSSAIRSAYDDYVFDRLSRRGKFKEVKP